MPWDPADEADDQGVGVARPTDVYRADPGDGSGQRPGTPLTVTNAWSPTFTWAAWVLVSEAGGLVAAGVDDGDRVWCSSLQSPSGRW